MVSLWVIFRRLRPEYVARVGSAPYDSRMRTTSRWSFSTASWIGLDTKVSFCQKGSAIKTLVTIFF